MTQTVALAFLSTMTKVAGVPGLWQRTKRVALGTGLVAAGAYGLGRGLQAGLSDRERAEKEEANRAARAAGMRPQY
jgi:hypothetical protein